jgi:hypothetical protein
MATIDAIEHVLIVANSYLAYLSIYLSIDSPRDNVKQKVKAIPLVDFIPYLVNFSLMDRQLYRSCAFIEDLKAFIQTYIHTTHALSPKG